MNGAWSGQNCAGWDIVLQVTIAVGPYRSKIFSSIEQTVGDQLGVCNQMACGDRRIRYPHSFLVAISCSLLTFSPRG